MKINKNRKKSKKFNKIAIATAIGVVLVAGYVFAVARPYGLWPLSSTEHAGHTSDKNPESDLPIDQLNQPAPGQGSNPGDKTPKQYETPGDDAGDTSYTDGTISANVNDGKAQIRATLYEVVPAGNCTLSMTHTSSGTTITRSAQTVQNPSSTSCKGWDIPVSELQSGDWAIEIHIITGSTSNELTGDLSL